MVQRYEALRRDVMQPSASGNQDVRGLALLVREGMAAWMRGSRPPCARAAAVLARPDLCAPTSTAAAPPERRAVGIEQMLVSILAAMTQAHAMEV